MKNLVKNNGNVLIEFALVMPVLLIILAGTVQFGFILSAQIAVNTASYEAVRTATLSENLEKAAIDSVLNYAASTLPGWKLDEELKVKIFKTGSDPGDIVEIQVIYNVPVFFSKILPAFNLENGFFTVTGSSTMKIEEKE